MYGILFGPDIVNNFYHTFSFLVVLLQDVDSDARMSRTLRDLTL